jgi:hypothetical protein
MARSRFFMADNKFVTLSRLWVSLRELGNSGRSSLSMSGREAPVETSSDDGRVCDRQALLHPIQQNDRIDV